MTAPPNTPDTKLDWPTESVSSLQKRGILLVEDGNHGEYRPRRDEFVSVGVAFIRAADMDSGRVLFDSAARINGHASTRITKGIGAPGDVLLSHKGTVGKVAIAPLDAPSFVCSPQTTFWRSLDPDQLDRQYLYAFLRSPGFRDQLAARAGETDMAPYVSLTSQRGLLVTLPPIDIQRGIGRVLGSLDDKIELNRRMSRTLEEMAAAIFKAWFVDFEPVKAKAAGAIRFPTMPQPVFDALPTELTDSPLGPIPKGWRVGQVRDCCLKIENGGTPKRSEARYWEPQEIPWLTSGEVRQDVITRTSNYISREGLGNSSSKLWPAGVTVVALYGATAGQVCFLAKEVCANQACCGLTPLEGFRHFNFLHMSRSIGELERQARGSAQQNLSQQIVADTQTLLPGYAAAFSFDQQVEPLFALWINNLATSETLAAIRDALLPKLLSGEIRVGAAGKLVGEVA